MVARFGWVWLLLLGTSEAAAVTPPRAFAPYGVFDGYGDALSILGRTLRDSVPFELKLRHHPPAAVGRVDGRLLFGVRMTDSPGVWIRDPDAAWAVPETIHALRAAHAEVERRHPGGMELSVGDISRRRGGRFAPHRTHQSGRDVDLRYYIKGVLPGDRERPYAHPSTIDLVRQWTFIDFLIQRGHAELIYIDYRHQKVLYRYAHDTLGMTAEDLEPIFSYPKAKRRRGAVIQHMPGHFNHLHVRIFAPKSQLVGLAYSLEDAQAFQQQVDIATVGHFEHVVRRGETLGHIARRHEVPLEDLLAWNRLGKRARLRPGKVLRIYARQ